jgi:hypothetical protein
LLFFFFFFFLVFSSSCFLSSLPGWKKNMKINK